MMVPATIKYCPEFCFSTTTLSTTPVTRTVISAAQGRHYAIFVKWSLQCVYCKIYSSGIKTNMGGDADNRRKPALAQSRSPQGRTLGYEFYSGGLWILFTVAVLNMMIESGEQYTHVYLAGGVKTRFGERARFPHLFSVRYGGGGTGRVSTSGERKVYCRGGRFSTHGKSAAIITPR